MLIARREKVTFYRNSPITFDGGIKDIIHKYCFQVSYVLDRDNQIKDHR